MIVVGCFNDPDVSEAYQFLEKEGLATVALDFSKNKRELIKYFEEEAANNFCKNKFLNTYFIYEKSKIVFPLKVFKYCGTNNNHENYISIKVKDNNEVLINHYPLNSSNSRIGVFLRAKTKYKVEKQDINNLLYVIQWDHRIDEDKIIARFMELLTFIKSYSDYISQKLFKKNINDLSDEELSVLREIYDPVIAIEQTIIPLIPFHPDDIEDK